MIRRAVCAASFLALGACTALGGGDRVNPEMPSWFTHPSGDMNLMFRRSLTIDARDVTAGRREDPKAVRATVQIVCQNP